MKIINAEQLPEDWFNKPGRKEFDTVLRILEDIKNNGDKAVRKYAQQFDGLDSQSFEITEHEIEEAYKTVDSKVIKALQQASENIEQLAKAQMDMYHDVEVKTNFGRIGQKVIPLKRVGCYVPGGKYPLPSTALMTVIPAKVAGVDEIIVCSPKIRPETIIAADLAGATRILRIGGVQAIGALAYGTSSIPKVDKIVGPGNQYVTIAKKEVFGEVGIDFLAGPSEVMVIADCSSNPALVAADLLAQAEHDELAETNAIVFCQKMAERIVDEVKRQITHLTTKDIARISIFKGSVLVCRDMDEAIEIVNRKAPEHLEIMLKNPSAILSKLRNYGSLFIGSKSAEVFGDYCSGTNHVLPTGGAARYTGGLSVKDFLKFVTYQEVDDPKKLIEIASELARVEGLAAHRAAALFRREEP